MKEISFEDIQKANETITTLDVKGKQYAEVNQRIKAFRMLYPQGTIETEMLSNENGVCVFKATVMVNDRVLGTGTAYEKENSTFINKTSYIENCETSAVGRALAMCGIGIDTSIASAEEVTNAINNQNINDLSSLLEEMHELVVNTETDYDQLLDYFKVSSDKEMSEAQLKKAIQMLRKKLK